MAYTAKTNWKNNDTVLPADMNRIEQGIKDVDLNKIDKTAIANNLTTTLEGKVLDARQGALLADNLNLQEQALVEHLNTNPAPHTGHATAADLMAHKAETATHVKPARFVIGTSTAGWTAKDCHFLCDGTDDQVEINAAIQALPATGGEIIILDGTYNITAKIDVSKSNVSIKGSGNATVLRRMWTSVGPEGVINLIGVERCCLEALRIDGNKDNGYFSTTAYGIFLSNSGSNKIANNYCDSSQNAITLSASGNNIVTSNRCSNNNNYAISLGDNSDSNLITGNVVRSSNYGVHLSNSGGNIVASNDFDGNKTPIGMVTSSNNTIKGNLCNYFTSNYGILIQTDSNNNIFVGNSASNGKTGLSIAPRCNNNTIANNVVCNNTVTGISVGSSTHNVILGNICRDNETGISLNGCQGNTIVGNNCTRGEGVSSDYTSTQYTIHLASTGNSYNLISSNNCLGKEVVIGGGTGNTEVNNKYQ